MDRLHLQLEFIKEVDKLKSVMRRSRLINGERYENTAEHSWHFAVMALILREHYHQGSFLDMLKVLKMALIHDLVEIYAGDTYCYDEAMKVDQATREWNAAKTIFGRLPEDMGQKLFDLWLEFERGESHEAKFARAIDRLNPFMLNFFSDGCSWQAHGVKKSQVLSRMGEIQDSCPALWSYVIDLLSQAIEKGWIVDDSTTMGSKIDDNNLLGNKTNYQNLDKVS